MNTKEYNRQYYLKNHERLAAYHKEWGRNNPMRTRPCEIREKSKIQVKKQRKSIKIEVLTHYGGGILACVKCGYDDVRALSIDHINNDGAKQRKDLSPWFTGNRLYIWLKGNNYPEGYQSLCMNCQWVKKNRDC